MDFARDRTGRSLTETARSSGPLDCLRSPRPTKGASSTVNLRLLTAEIVGTFAVFALALFLAAGTLAWPAGWAYMGLFFGYVVAGSLWLLRHDPGLLTERMTGLGKPGQKAWDKLFYGLVSVVFLAWLALMPLDAVRFRWSDVPAWLQAIGAMLLLASFCLFFLTARENPYLSPVIRVQTERGQTVVSTGPYHYVRHPMYVGAAAYLLGTSLMLGSLYGLLLGLLLVLMMGIRAVMEERTLRDELPGYDAYMREVKYRLVPRIW